MVDQIVGRRHDHEEHRRHHPIDIDVLHRIAQDWYQRLKLHEIDDSVIQIEATSDGLKVTLFHGDEKPFLKIPLII